MRFAIKPQSAANNHKDGVGMQGSAEVRYGNKQLVTSGSFLCFGDGVTSLKVMYRNDYINLDINLLKSSTDLEKSKLELHPKTDDTLELRLTNYRLVRKPQTIGPIPAGEISGQPFFILLGISGGDPKNLRSISYSVYVDDIE